MFSVSEMPRYSLSANQSQFDTLFSLLNRIEEYSVDVWDLVRMLNTNKQIFTQILSLKNETEGEIDWSTVFGDSSLFKKIYKQEIIMAVMEREEAEMTERVVITDEQDEVLTDKKTEAVEESKEEIEKKRELRELKKIGLKCF